MRNRWDERTTYGYGGIEVPPKSEQLFDAMLDAEADLRRHDRAMQQPIGSFAWEDEVESGPSRATLLRRIEIAKAEYDAYMRSIGK